MKKQEKTDNTAGFSAEEKAAMKAYLKEKKAQEKAQQNREAGEHDVLAAIAEMPEPDHSMAARIHEIVTTSVPELMPRTWYGMPAYANAAGKVVCFFQNASKFGARYGTVGFNDSAHLDDGAMWATSFALTELTPAVEKRIAALVKQAVS